MQKKILAAAVAALCGVAGTAMAQQAGGSKVELWGIVDAAIRSTSNGGTTQMMGGGMSQSRWGLKGEEDLGAGSKAIFEVENRFNADDGTVSNPFFQLAYVGLQGPYGRLTMGRQWNVLFDVVTSTYASFPYSPYMEAYKPELGMAVGARTSNALKYTIATPDRRWAAGLQYSFDEKNNTLGLERDGIGAGQSNLAANMADIQAQAAAAGNAAGQQYIANWMAANPGVVPPQAVQDAAQAIGLQVGQQTGQLLGSQAVQTGLTNYMSSDAGRAAISAIGAGATRTMGGFLRYSANGISLGGGYLKTKLPGGSDVDAWTLGGSYRSGALYFNLGYGLNKFKPVTAARTAPAEQQLTAAVRSTVDRLILGNMWGGQTNGGFQIGDSNKRQMFKVGLGYQITPQINAGLHYYHAKQSGSASLASNGKANFIVAAVDYAFSKRTDAYFAVDNTRVSGGAAMAIDVSGARSRTGITAGIRHRF